MSVLKKPTWLGQCPPGRHVVLECFTTIPAGGLGVAPMCSKCPATLKTVSVSFVFCVCFLILSAEWADLRESSLFIKVLKPHVHSHMDGKRDCQKFMNTMRIGCRRQVNCLQGSYYMYMYIDCELRWSLNILL